MPKKEAAVVEEVNPVCSGAEVIVIEREREQCDQCSNGVWRNGMCFTHWRENEGFVFDEEKKVFVKRKGK